MSQAALERTAPIIDQISARNFERLARYIYEYSGIKMPSTKRTMLEGRLRRRLRVTGYPTFDDYCDYLFKEDGLEAESVFLIDAVTTNKTDFFREPRHFDYMASHVLPELKAAEVRRIRAWSAACSMGAEPYTMAMVMQKFADEQGGPDYQILGTDLSTDVLETALRGVYPNEMLTPVPADMRRWVMTSRDSTRREGRIHPSLRAKLSLARVNLMDEAYSVGDPFDIIMCRNVMIYFDKQTQAKVLKRLCDRLKRGGHLFIGHSESITGIELPLVTVANTVFRKI
ncbi:CheR family methyltransferase [Brevundimonas sp. SL130]|uniref:CheR family methyltransferase n=1 Tax=Brevundimonas sp. SL130 TaxID=2995143 RepID=UPI00226D1AB1|nr:CheR family methyltransferase [Brevundimonas sp. SL130]WAC60541.1 chemotaxis protein CheR [Brevundimonas sp. SL130]